MNDDFSELLGDFLLEAEERRARVEAGLLALADGERADGDDPEERLTELRRELHTLKGNAGMMGLTELQTEAHRMEDLMAELDVEHPAVGPLLAGVDRIGGMLAALGGDPIPAAAEPTVPWSSATGPSATEGAVRVPRAALDELSELMAELAVARHHLEESSERVGSLDPRAPGFGERFVGACRRLEEARLSQDRLLRGVRAELEEIQRVPFRTLFGKLRRLVHDESERLGKTVRLVTRGEDAPIDRSLVELAGEVLGHLVRNAVVHGIEASAERRARDKPEAGTVLVSASAGASTLDLAVVDDGDGVRLERLRRAAARGGGGRRGDLYSLLFRPGLSTLAGADLGAGRGMGLAAVETAAGRYGGTVEVSTVEGVGTRFGLRLPASAAVTVALLVEADGERYALPVTAVVETASLAEVGGGRRRWSEWRDRLIEIADLGVEMGTSRRAREAGAAVIVAGEGRHLALAVDRFGGLRELVVRELDPLAARSPGIAGSSLLGDGGVVLVLDPRAFGQAAESVA